MRVAAVIPAYNEERRIERVLEAVCQADCVDEIIVVNDGSQDNTAEVASKFSGVRVLDLPRNKGKGGALFAGVSATDAPIVLFLDADLIGLKPEHIEAIVEPVVASQCAMAIGVFRGGRFLTDWAQRLAPMISGQRALKREIFLSIPGVEEARMGVEVAMTLRAKQTRCTLAMIPVSGITHTMKEEKLGWLKGTAARWRMYYEIFRTVARMSAISRAQRRLRKSNLD